MEATLSDRNLAQQERNRKVRNVLLGILAANWVVAGAKLAFGMLSQDRKSVV